MFYTYVLRSLRNQRFYIGSTNDIERRLFEHNSGKSRYTKFNKPFELIYTEKYNTRKEAVKREMSLKSGQGRKWLKENLSRTVA